MTSKDSAIVSATILYLVTGWVFWMVLNAVKKG